MRTILINNRKNIQIPTLPTTSQHSGNKITKYNESIVLKPRDKKDGLKKDICKSYKEKEEYI